jgi:hypothetical protein
MNPPAHSPQLSSLQQPLNVRQPASLHLITLTLFLSERQTHQFALVLLDAENIVLNSTPDCIAIGMRTVQAYGQWTSKLPD